MQRKNWPRRSLLGGAGLAGVAGVGTFLYRAAPAFWQQYSEELKRPIAAPPHQPSPFDWPDKGLHAAWLGHSTVLLKIDGFTILTDPVFSDRAGIHLGLVTLGVKRLIAPALVPDRLPPIDLILLSHAHMDHFDIPSLRELANRRTTVVTARATSDLLRRPYYREVREIGWGEKTRVGPALIRGLEVNHWGARVRTDTFRGYNGYVIEVGRHRVVFAGDTAITGHFQQVRHVGPVELAIMPIGAYNPWHRFHCTPEEAWQMGNDARAEFVLPVHHQTFALSREPVLEPIERLRDAARSSPHRVVLEQIGEEFHLT
jgi:L-ascorbate metabolism protein UlaG (beta-lactamase superfamily)